MDKTQVVLALGSNLGNRHLNLESAVNKLKQFINIERVSNIYKTPALLPNESPKSWDLDFYNIALIGETSLDPVTLLNKLKLIESDLGRNINSERWSPRIIDIDVIFFGDHIIDTESLTIPHKNAHERSFVLTPISNIAPNFVHPTFLKTVGELHYEKFSGICNAKDVIPFSPKIMGIVNVTTNSFSGDGILKNNDLLQVVDTHLENGVFSLDIGAQSTNPKATLISSEEELAAIDFAIKNIKPYLLENGLSQIISIDTFRHEVLEHAIKNNFVDIVNDVNFARDENLVRMAAEANLKYVLTHSTSVPANKADHLDHDSPAHLQKISIISNKIDKILSLGIKEEKLILDPGMGFGTTQLQDIDIIKNISAFKKLGFEVLFGHSRKFFMGLFNTSTPGKERDIETAVISSYVANHVDHIRVHNTAFTKKALVTSFIL
jgi:2-amino-4-hydroxy-6-hydroxymethyldihydropteridine diphosphokinase/dihydropteroate synthase